MSNSSQDAAPAGASADGRHWLARHGRWVVIGVLVAVAVSVMVSGGGQGLADKVRNHWDEIRAWVEANPVPAFLASFLVYVLVTGLSIPVANVLTIGAGALFGRWVGLELVAQRLPLHRKGAQVAGAAGAHVPPAHTPSSV